MKLLAMCAVLVAAFAAPATADSRYDEKLEQAVMDIVAEKIGEIRGGFSYDSPPVFVAVPDPMQTGTTLRGAPPLSEEGWNDGLAVAVERKLVPAVAF